MTVSSTSTKDTFALTGAGTGFTFTSKIFAKSDLVVIRRDTAGVETILDLITDYTIAGTSWPTGGTITTVTNYTDGTLIIKAVLPKTQAYDYVTADKFPANSHEFNLDRAVLLIQELHEIISRIPQLAETSAFSDLVFPDPVANYLVGFNADGTDLEALTSADIDAALVTVWAATLLAASTAAAGRTILELSSSDVIAALTFEPTGDTAASDNAAFGYTAAEGAILTGQGSANDVTLKNDADAVALSIPTGTTNIDVVGDLTASTVKADGDTSAGDSAAIGYTVTEGLILTGQGSTNDVTIKNDADADVISIPTGDVNVEFAGTALFAAGEGIVLNGDAIAAANTLDDYEEGTWTPVISDGTNDATMNGTYGSYTKIGRAVHIKAKIGTTSLGSVSGDLRITGLPFTSESTTDSYSSLSLGYANGLAITASESVAGYVVVGGSHIAVVEWDQPTGISSLTHAEWTADGQCYISGTYYV